MTRLVVEFCGEVAEVLPGSTFVIGREADLSVDDNPYLHRRLVELTHDRGFWWVRNVGTRIAVTVSGEAGSLQASVAPGSGVPLVLPTAALLFTAGDTTYEVGLECEAPAFDVVRDDDDLDGDVTLGSVDLTASQLRLLVALSERTLSRVGTGGTTLPTNAEAARRLGWSMSTFNRKLDNVCEKYARAGVKGLRGGRDGLATSRRARLVEYVVAARIVRPEHLPLLDAPGTGEGGAS